MTMPFDAVAAILVIPAAAAEYAGRAPQDILSLALTEFSPDVGISFSGAEDAKRQLATLKS